MRLSAETLSLLAEHGDASAQLAICYLEYRGMAAFSRNGHIYVAAL